MTKTISSQVATGESENIPFRAAKVFHFDQGLIFAVVGFGPNGVYRKCFDADGVPRPGRWPGGGGTGHRHLRQRRGGLGGRQEGSREARAALITDAYSAHQGVEDDDMNVICLGGRVTGYALAWELIQTFLRAHFQTAPRFQRRLNKVAALERELA